jgi:hypothetical protein
MRFQEPLSEEASYNLGKECFELWVNLGTADKANMEFRRRHPDKEWMNAGVTSRRARSWWIENSAEGFEIMKAHNPSAPDFMLEEKLLDYALNKLNRKGRFMAWVDKNPWVKKYESVYSKFYASKG